MGRSVETYGGVRQPAPSTHSGARGCWRGRGAVAVRVLVLLLILIPGQPTVFGVARAAADSGFQTWKFTFNIGGALDDVNVSCNAAGTCVSTTASQSVAASFSGSGVSLTVDRHTCGVAPGTGTANAAFPYAVSASGTITVPAGCSDAGTVYSWTATITNGTMTPPPPPGESSTETATAAQSPGGPPTDTCNVVNPSQHIQICVPSYLSASTTGSAALVNSNGQAEPFTGNLPPGDGLSTGPDGYVDVSDPGAGATLSLAPGSSLVSNVRGYIDQGKIFTCEKSPSHCVEAVSYNLSLALNDALDKALKGQITLALYTMAKGEINALEDVLKAIPNVVTCLAAANTMACHESGSDVDARVGQDGTEFDVVSGSWVVVNFASGQLVSLSAGEKVSVPKDPAQAARQNLTKSVASFDPGSVNRWWEQQSTSARYLLGGLAFIAAVNAVMFGVAVRRRRGKRRSAEQQAHRGTV